jgi:hypothetical protein
MAEKSLAPTVQKLAALPENAFLEFCRDTERSESEHAFKEAGVDALNAAGRRPACNRSSRAERRSAIGEYIPRIAT